MKDRRNALKQTDKDIAAAGKECDKCDKKIEEARIGIKKLEHSMKQMDSDTEDAKKAMEHQLRQHPWIKHERQHFGKAGGEYDWDKEDPVKMQKKLNELKTQQDSLGKKINKKVMGMFEKAEQEYQVLCVSHVIQHSSRGRS